MPRSKSANFTFALEPHPSTPTMDAHSKNTSQDADIYRGILYSNAEESMFLRTSFSIIVVCTILGSVMVCAVNIKNKGMLKSPYNVNIFHLAITDLLVSFVVLVTPGFIFQEIPFASEGGLSGEIFCRVITSHFLTFSTATTSMYITVALATERWYAVARPFQYRAKFHTKRLVCQVFIIWLLSLCANSLLPFEVKFNPDKNASFESCEVVKIPFFSPTVHKLLGIAQFMFKFIIPFTINCNLYIRVLAETRNSRVMNRRNGLDMRLSISRMAANSTLVLALCWLPNQVFYACFAFDLVQLNTPAHFSTIVIALINPCLNPFIFAFHSVQYRRGFRNLFCGGAVKDKDKLKQRKRFCMFRLTELSHCCPEDINASLASSPV